MAEHKSYRHFVNEERFFLFELNYKESNLLIGVDHAHWTPHIAFECGRYLEEQRGAVDRYLANAPQVAKAWQPVMLDSAAPALLVRMASAASLAGVGPMAAVAGAFAGAVHDFIRKRYGAVEVMVENGGDCALTIENDLTLAVFAGELAGTARHGLCLTPGSWGIASSSGRVGHSSSLGKADVCTLICADPAVADAYATAFANRLGSQADIEAVLAAGQDAAGVIGVYVSVAGSIGCYGPFRLCPLQLGN